MKTLEPTGKEATGCLRELRGGSVTGNWHRALNIATVTARCRWTAGNITLYSPVVTICTASLTFNNSTFCPHTVFMCFVWISEQTAIISLYSIN